MMRARTDVNKKVLARSFGNRTSDEKHVTVPQHADSLIQLMKEKKKRKVDEFIIDVRPPVPGVKHTYTITSRRPTRCKDLRAG